MKRKNSIEKAYMSIIAEQEEPIEQAAPAVVKKEEPEVSADAFDLQSLKEKYANKEVNRDDIVDLLNIAVNDELLASYNYLASYTRSKTEGKSDFDPEFEAHEHEEMDHAHDLITRLREMDAPVLITNWADMPVKNSAGNMWKQELGTISIEMLKSRYNEELAAIDFYSFVLECIYRAKNNGEFDTSTETLIKKIKKDEEEHAMDLRDLLNEYEAFEAEEVDDEK